LHDRITLKNTCCSSKQCLSFFDSFPSLRDIAWFLVVCSKNPEVYQLQGQIFSEVNKTGENWDTVLNIIYLKQSIFSHIYWWRYRLVCSKNITSAPAYIASPYYPSYYVNNIHCSWNINAPEHHVIRLKFLDFMLEKDDVCSDDFVQVYDGDERTGTSLGKFCGYIYPEFVQSSSNSMTIIFHSNSAMVRTGFKALVNFTKGL